MARKPTAAVEFVLFDALYEDGTQRSNRRVPATALAGVPDPMAAARAVLEAQDRDIAQRSGVAPAGIKTVKRSGKK